MNLRLHLSSGADWASTHLEKSNPNARERHTASGIYVSHDNVGFYVDYSSILDRIPQPLEQDATHFTLRDELITQRADGLYRYKTARALVQKSFSTTGEKDRMVVHVDLTAKRLCHLIALYRGLQTGHIEPFESWEQPQVSSQTTPTPDPSELPA